MSVRVARLSQDLFTRRGIFRAIEMAALLPATVLLAPVLMAGSAGMGFALLGMAFDAKRPGVKLVAMGPILLLLMLMVVGYASLAFLWFLLLGGVRTIRTRPWLRGAAVLLLLLGLADAMYFLFADRQVTVAVKSGISSMATWAVLLGFPMLLGVRYLYLLLRPDDGREMSVSI